MELSVLLQLYAWNCYGSLAIGLALNFLLLFVAKNCPSRGLREYRRVVYYFSFQNILLLIFQAVNQPLVLTGSNNYTYVLLNGPIAQVPSHTLWLISVMLFFILLVHVFTGLAMLFIERYLVICRNHQNKLCRHLTLHGILGLFSILSIAPVILGIPRTDLQLADLNEPIFSGIETIIIKNIKIVCQSDLENPLMKTIMIGLTGFSMYSYLATLFCYLRIRAFLKANMQTDVVHGVRRKTLKNIICSMLIQSIVPIYSLALGALLLGISMIAQHGPIFGQFLLVFFALYNWLPVLNPLVTILTIDEYRRGAICIFKRKQQHQITPTVPFVISQNT